MEHVLRGVDGYRHYERDGKGREIAAYRGDSVQPRHGRHVRLTIDMELQRIVEEVLEETGPDRESIYVPQLNAEKVSVVLLEPHTGAVLAMANRPHFDLETRKGVRLNAAVSSVYEPGSTFKIVTLSGALHHGLVRPTTTIVCAPDGVLKEDGFVVRDDHPYPELTTEGVLIKSSNIGAYRLASQLGKSRLHEMMQVFGFGRRTGVSLGAEAAGRVYHPKRWSKPSLSRMAMGYEVAVTPLQMATALSIIANDGIHYQPRIVDAVFDDKGLDVDMRRPKPVGRVLAARTALQMKRALQKVCEKGGTGTRAVVPGYTMAGKTGTTQKYDEQRRAYLRGRYVVSFMGFTPVEDPKIIGVVVVDDPKIDYVKRYGGTIAAPIFKRIAERSLGYLNVDASPELANVDHPNQ